MGRKRHHRIWVRRRLIEGCTWSSWGPCSPGKAIIIEHRGPVIGQVYYEVVRGSMPTE